jgi:hypothetical protein
MCKPEKGWKEGWGKKKKKKSRCTLVNIENGEFWSGEKNQAAAKIIDPPKRHDMLQ